jgi:outer membrane lipoprotein-sorting protein
MESEIQYKQWIKKVINSISDKDVRYLYNRSIYEVLKQWKRQDVNSFDLKQLLLSLTTSSLKLALSYIVDVIDERERYNMLQHASSDKTEDEINKYIIDLIFYGLGFSQCS